LILFISSGELASGSTQEKLKKQQKDKDTKKKKQRRKWKQERWDKRCDEKCMRAGVKLPELREEWGWEVEVG
jgi:hypothetical protein